MLMHSYTLLATMQNFSPAYLGPHLNGSGVAASAGQVRAVPGILCVGLLISL